jgi:xylulose-5-phosphate/fructose-6-phosphate phosphoketolase
VNEQLSAYGPARSTVRGNPLSPHGLRQTHAFWRACNYLALGMIYLRENPLLRAPLEPAHIKNRLLGHWGPVRRFRSSTPTSTASSAPTIST